MSFLVEIMECYFLVEIISLIISIMFSIKMAYVFGPGFSGFGIHQYAPNNQYQATLASTGLHKLASNLSRFLLNLINSWSIIDHWMFLLNLVQILAVVMHRKLISVDLSCLLSNNILDVFWFFSLCSWDSVFSGFANFSNSLCFWLVCSPKI